MHNAPSPLLCRSAAFTMIEIMIVVVIFGITAAVALPMLGNRSSVRLAAAARKVIADLQYAENLAISTRDSIYVRCDTDAYTLCRKAGTTLTTVTHPIDKTGFAVRVGSDPTASALRDVRLDKPSFGGNVVLGFDTLGVPFSYNEVTAAKSALTTRAQLRLTCGGLEQLINIEPYTGEISVP